MYQRDETQFYPTPPSLQKKVFDKLNMAYRGSSIAMLDPSAGTGDLLLDPRMKGYCHRQQHYTADVCEIDQSRFAILQKTEGLTVVGMNFLDYFPQKHYTHIVMNPPFAMGADHLLHAWKIARNTEILCILNAQTIRNPNSQKKQAVVRLIEEHGDCEYVKEAFLDPKTQRRTHVEVALVYLKKEEAPIGNFLDGLHDLVTGTQESESNFDDSDAYTTAGDLAIPKNVIDNAVALYTSSCAVLRRKCEATAVLGAEYSRIASLLGGSLTESKQERNARIQENSDNIGMANAGAIAKAFNDEHEKLKQSSWNYVLSGIGFYKKLSRKAKSDFRSQFEKISKLDFTASNVHGFLSGVALQYGKINDDMVLELFDRITERHPENCLFHKAWKSNAKHRSGAWRVKHTRIILPVACYSSYGTHKWEAEQSLRDIDMVMALLDNGKDVNGVKDNDGNWIQEPIFGLSKATQKADHGERCDSEYFEFRMYSSTIHLFPKRMDLIERLNRTVGRLRQWIPDQDEEGTNEFWKNYNSSKTTADLAKRDYAYTSTRYGYRMDYGDGKYENALEKAIDESLRSQGIDPAKCQHSLEHKEAEPGTGLALA